MLRRTADRIPNGTATTMAISIANVANCAVAGKPVQDQRQGRLFGPQRFAQITARHIGQVPQVLNGQRIIEAKLGAQFLEICLGGARAGQHDQHWVTG